jgi:DNA-binding GntR family transcriptional regulator
VHTNTVLRALRMLRDEGLLEVGRGRAITVAATPERGVVVTKMKELIDLARRNGYRRDELLAMMERLAYLPADEASDRFCLAECDERCSSAPSHLKGRVDYSETWL